MQFKRDIYVLPEENLTHKVQGKRASDIEERSAKAIYKLSDWKFSFRVRISPLTRSITTRILGIAGEYEIDFLCFRGDIVQPILIDGEYSHFKSDAQKLEDERRESVINSVIGRQGAQPVIRVPYYQLNTQERADRYFRELLQ